MSETVKCTICKEEKDRAEFNQDTLNGPFPVCSACLEPAKKSESMICEETGIPCEQNTSMPGHRCQCETCQEYFKDSPF